MCSGACLHQGPTRKRASRGQPESSDLYVCQPNYPVLLCDAKMDDFEAALRETTLYCATAMTTQSEMLMWPILLGLAFTPAESQFFIVGAGADRLWHCIVHCGRLSDKAQLCTVYCAVHFLLKQLLFSKSLLKYPTSEFHRILTPLVADMNCRVFTCKSNRGALFVRKYYKLLHAKNFHTELLQEIGAFDNLTVEELIPGKLCVQQYS